MVAETIISIIGLTAVLWIVNEWSSARKECSQKLEEWKKREKKIRELLSLPVSDNNGSLAVAQCHNCQNRVTINAKTKEELLKTLDEWKKYEAEAKFHRIGSVFGLILAIANIALMTYEAFIFLAGWKLPATLKPYEDLLGMHLLFGVIVIGVAGVFIDPPQAPDEKAEPQIQEEKEEERRRLMDDDRQDYSTTVREPYSSIFGMEPSTHRRD